MYYYLYLMPVGMHACIVNKICIINYSFGNKISIYPHPEENWLQFINIIHNLNIKYGKVYNPRVGKMCYWINESQLSSAYSPATSCCVM